MIETWCLVGCHYRKTNNETQKKKKNPKFKKFDKINKGTCSICGRNKSQIFTE